jgi:hypothetical protein
MLLFIEFGRPLYGGAFSILMTKTCFPECAGELARC